MTRLSVPSADSDLSRRPSADIIDITESGDELDAMVAGLDPFSSDEMHVVLSSLTSVAAVTLGGGGGSNEPLRRGDGSKGDASKGGVSKECMSKGGVSTPLAEEEEEGSAVADSRGMVTTHTDLRRMAEMALRDVHMNNKDAQTISPAVVMAPSSASSSSSSSCRLRLLPLHKTKRIDLSHNDMTNIGLEHIIEWLGHTPFNACT